MDLPWKARLSLALTLAGALALHGRPAGAQTVIDPFAPGGRPAFTTLGDWGGVGLMQTRTARFAPDGAFDVGYSFVDPYKRYSITLAAFPWLEATFRYTEVRNKLYGDPTFSGDQRYKDRGADLKFRLWGEGRWRPAVAVGFQDLLGTGLFAGEYIVASKRWLDFDFSAGLGWGQIGSAGTTKNPFTLISDRFRERTGPTGTGGQVAFETFFGGETVGIFGGVEYHTPIEGVTLKLEYDSHRFRETDLTHPSDSPVNFGVVFRPYSWLEMSLGRERGNTTMLRFSLRSNIQSGGLPKQDPPPPALVPRPTLGQLTAPLAPPASPGARPGAQPAGPAPATAAPPDQRSVPVPVAPAPGPRPAAIAPPPRAAAAAAPQGEPLFDTLAARGFAAEDVRLDGAAAVVLVSRTGSSGSLRDASVAALDVLPPDVETLVLVDRTGGVERERQQVRRNRAANVRYADDLHGRMAALGIDVLAVEFLGNDLRVTVTPRIRTQAVDLAAVAREAAAALPLGGTVTAIDGPTGRGETWLTFAQPNPYVPPRTTPAAVSGQTFRLPPAERPPTDNELQALRVRMHAALDEQGITLEALELHPRQAFIALSAFRFRQGARNIGLAARVVANNLPDSVEEITIAFLNGGLEMERATFLRSDLEHAAANSAPEQFWNHLELTPGLPGQPGREIPERYPAFSWSLSPQLRQHIGGPDQFYLYQVWLALSGSVDIARGLTLTGTVGKNLYHNFDKIRLQSDSSLPRVRSDIKDYLQQGTDNIVRLQANYFFKATESVYTRLTVGLLEEMYGGVSAEVLYRPFGSRLALGAEWNWVQKRDFDQRFKFLDYKVQTGHLSLYYDTPYKGVLVSTHVGTYLAGDRGVTLELSRRFDTGVRVGLWATFTNVTPQQFGEGSFDKGFFITIPMDLFYTRSVPNEGVFGFRPLTRDGGQRLIVSPRLYDSTNNGTLEAATRDWPQVLR